MNRKIQLWLIIALTAITMMPQYALQGWLAFGGSPVSEVVKAGVTSGFWLWLSKVDPLAWSLRALVEAWALVYLFSSDAKAEQDAKWLARFEVALIVLITITLGPALAATGLGKSIKEALAWWPAFWLWNFAIASYAPLMLGAVGFAFRLEQSKTESDKQKQANPESKISLLSIAKASDSESQAKQNGASKRLPQEQKEFACECGRSFATVQALNAHGRFCEQVPVSINGKQ